MVDDKLNQIDEVKQEVIDRREMLREKASKDPNISTACENSDNIVVRQDYIQYTQSLSCRIFLTNQKMFDKFLSFRREKILAELLSTEK